MILTLVASRLVVPLQDGTSRAPTFGRSLQWRNLELSVTFHYYRLFGCQEETGPANAALPGAPAKSAPASLNF